jgi:hypothetical protein
MECTSGLLSVDDLRIVNTHDVSSSNADPLRPIANNRYPVVVISKVCRLMLDRILDSLVDIPIASQIASHVSGKQSDSCAFIHFNNGGGIHGKDPGSDAVIPTVMPSKTLAGHMLLSPPSSLPEWDS